MNHCVEATSDQLAGLVRRFVLPLAMAACLCSPSLFAGESSSVPDSESHALDFWLGDWVITAPGGTGSSTSKVYFTLDSHLLIESWEAGPGHEGENIVAYNPQEKSWHWLFVDNRGHVHAFTGTVKLGQGEFKGTSQGANGEPVLNRLRLMRVSPDQVEQTWEQSTDNGATWTMVFPRGVLAEKQLRDDAARAGWSLGRASELLEETRRNRNTEGRCSIGLQRYFHKKN
jgi:hypothetical protein